MGNNQCCDVEDRWLENAVDVDHDESVEAYAYVIAGRDEELLTEGCPPCMPIVDHQVSMANNCSSAMVDEDRPVNVSMGDGESLHRSIELVEGSRNESGQIQGSATARYKDHWE